MSITKVLGRVGIVLSVAVAVVSIACGGGDKAGSKEAPAAEAPAAEAPAAEAPAADTSGT